MFINYKEEQVMKKCLILLFFINMDEVVYLLDREPWRIEQKQLRNKNEIKLKELENSKLGTEIKTKNKVKVDMDESKLLVKRIVIKHIDNFLNRNEEFSFFNR